MFSLESFLDKYETDTTEVAVNGRKFQILLPKHLFEFVNPHDVLHEFPLWVKIWPASWVLAGYLAEIPVDAQKRFLEIGAGAGLVSIVACSWGHRVTMTECNADALLFARANAHINNCPRLPIMELDWRHPRLEGKFDCIVGSEVFYKKEELQPLLALFKTYLKPGGQIILAAEMRRMSKEFYKALAAEFDIRVHKKVLRSENEQIHIFLFRMSSRN